MRSTRAPLRTMRPKLDGSGILTVTSAIAGAVPSAGIERPAMPRKISPVTSGMSPQATTERPPRAVRGVERDALTAWPVPSCSCCTTLSHARNASISSSQLGVGDDDDLVDTRRAAARCSTYQSIGRPQISCRTFERALFMRVPLPAASTIARITRHRSRSRTLERVAEALANEVASEQLHRIVERDRGRAAGDRDVERARDVARLLVQLRRRYA